MSINNQIPPAEALTIHSLITPTEHGIASRVLAKTAGGNLTLFAFDGGQRNLTRAGSAWKTGTSCSMPNRWEIIW